MYFCFLNQNIGTTVMEPIFPQFVKDLDLMDLTIMCLRVR